MDNIFNQANLQKAGAFLDSENGKKAEEFVHQKTGIDVAQYTSGLSGNSNTNNAGNQDGQQTQGKPNEQSSSNDDPDYGSKQNVQQSSAGNYDDYQNDSTTSGGYGGDPFSRSAQTGGDDAQSRGQFGGDSKQESSEAYRTSDSQGHSRSGSDYGGASGATTPFEQKTGGFSAISSNNFQQRDEDGRQSSDNVGA